MFKKNFLFAFKTTLPVLFGYLALGIAFGLMLIEKGYPFWLAPLMSFIMYAGAGQFLAIGLFAIGTPLQAILITEFFVNIRHIVYGLSLITKFKNIHRFKPYLIWTLTDETYSLLSTTEIPNNINSSFFYIAVSALDHFYWIMGGILGAVIGSILTSTTNFSLGGIDFALTALFAVLLVEQILKTKDFLPPLIGAFTTFFFIFLWKLGILKSSNDILIAALSLGIIILVIIRRQKTDYKEEK